MWVYQKMLQYPAGVTTTCPRLAKDIITQWRRTVSGRFNALPTQNTHAHPQAKAVLTDIGTEELAHMEIVASGLTACKTPVER